LDGIRDLEKSINPLRLADVPDPEPAQDEILVRVAACGVCHTEIDEIEGRTPPPRWPVIPGHQVVGRVAGRGERAQHFSTDERVGVAWIFSACGSCDYCRTGRENLCEAFLATGRDADGGYAQYMTVPERFAYPIPEGFSDIQAAPLLCAGAIGYRSLRLTGIQDGAALGLTGFGASAHLVLQIARRRFPRSNVYVFARSPAERQFAGQQGAAWTGDTTATCPVKLDAIIDTTPAWKPVVAALANLKAGGRLVINAIRKEDRDRDQLLGIQYAEHLWQEKEIKSVANVTRRDVSEFLQLASRIPIQPEVAEFDLSEANRALMELKTRKIRGAKVLIVNH
jgi:propanol-preferring alcohol dehydrogenase